jgi:ubiquinone/menaquinone biosynthesis C-methylase UbiE
VWPNARRPGRYAAWVAPSLDQLYRHPFEGGSARRYATQERPAFGDLDDRLLDDMAPSLAGARRLLDVGCGPATFARRAAERFPHLEVIALDPSRDFARGELGSVGLLRARAEELPLPDRAIDVAICLSSLRHVADRDRALAELRRVARRLVIVELDPLADERRIAAHRAGLGSWLLRRAFGPLVVRTAPRASTFVALATRAGWRSESLRDDPVQPVYIAELA